MALPSFILVATTKFFQSLDQIATLVLMSKGIITIAEFRASRLTAFPDLQRSRHIGHAALAGMGERMAERFLPIYMMAVGDGRWPPVCSRPWTTFFWPSIHFQVGICQIESAPKSHLSLE